ncbi:hypothetical protein [uncultured Clostridium sp.]|uniref:hypothetical protein n=1 Tax=uncultured Clostridium sp. TaxID=59620 RepID=UPI0025D5BA67|nr:hypothetical protein [uncultured Clostridium sp.]
MKKKFLSLMMAAAVVATTSVSAFAADTENVINGPESETHESKIEITGDILNDDGTSVPGTLNVTIPTTASFTVNQSGVFSAAKIKVANKGTQNIQVFAYEFKDINGTSGINVRKKSELTSAARNNIALSISGDEGIAYLSSDFTNKGIYKDPELTQTESAAEGIKLATVNAGKTGQLTLDGETGNGNLANPARDTFTLKLKIKKA